MRRSWCCLPVVILAGTLTAAAGAEPKWNLISIVTDDQASWSLRCYGNKENRTPATDRLAREGALFRNAFVPTPVCSPSRASFLSGLYGTQVGITDWIAPQEADAGAGLLPEVSTWPKVLQRNGYRTGLFGKWHLGQQPRFHPTRNGFDRFVGFLGGGSTPQDPTLEKDGQTQKFKGCLADLITTDALDFIQAGKDKPFAVLLHFREPHLPYGPVLDEDAAPFKDLDPTIPEFPGLDRPQVKKWTRDYYASIHSIERNLDRLLNKLDEWKLASNTIVLFTSDHGYNIGHHGIHTKGNGVWIAGGVTGPKRPNMFDTSLRVPLLIRWPGVAKPGSVIEAMVSNVDTYPSVLGMLGLPLPRNAKVEGLDFSPWLRGQKPAWRDALFGQYDLHNGGLAYMRMVRTAEWKLVRHNRANGLDELYHLSEDPDESRNLYGNPRHREVREQLQERLTAWQKSIDDPLLRQSR